MVVDAGQGVEAQTLANCYTAIEMDLEVVPILNKIDLPAADPDRVAEEIEEIVGIDATDATRCSAKTGLGVDEVLETIVKSIPAPEGDPEAPTQALIIDSWFDNYLGVVSLVRISGVYGNLLANRSPNSSHAVITLNDDDTYTVSLRAPLNNKQGAGEICSSFATGGGREAAAGINALPKEKIAEFIQVVEGKY